MRRLGTLWMLYWAVVSVALAVSVAPAWAQTKMGAAAASGVFFVAGLVGAGLKAYFSNDQATLGKKSVGDVILGGVSGILVPVLLPLPTDWNIVQQGALVVGLSYFGVDLIQNALQKVGVTLPPTPPKP